MSNISVGDTIGNWTVVELLPYGRKSRRAKCRCVCGTEKILWESNIARTVSCGCMRRKNKSDPQSYPCSACGHNDDCTGYKQCYRYQTWFKREWSIIRAAAENLKGEKGNEQ